MVGMRFDMSGFAQQLQDCICGSQAFLECCCCGHCCAECTCPTGPAPPPAGLTCGLCDTDTTPSSITVTFGTGTNLGGSGNGCSGNCDDFAAAWACPQLTQTQVDTLNASWSGAFTNQPPTAGCYYGSTSGLPCGTSAIVVELLSNGSTGTALGATTICYPDLTYARLDFQIYTSGSNGNCVTNFNTGGSGCDSVGWAGDASEPCDFINVLFDYTLMDIVAVA